MLFKKITQQQYYS